MRLINTETLAIQSFPESRCPSYAILSHTWGDSEITLNEFTHKDQIRGIKSKAGFYKIISACQQARQDNLAYVWIDTCCIDKSSSAELSEAINSMWRYYERSAMCYAYLDDVDVFDPLRGGHGVSNASDGSSEELTSKQVDLIDEKDLARSRWFTRGWTLQELIAPARVAFYIKGWNFVGYKATMGRKLERITGIGTEILMEHWPKLDTVSVARRMSWAAKRETTRVEDMAYCLLGIFDVNMPLLYGEGEKAFVRLQEEIMKDSDDHSLFAWKPPNALGFKDLRKTFPISPLKHKGIFASHPSEFAGSQSVRPSGSKSEPYTLTNKGVRMEIPMSPIPCEANDMFLAVLECYGKDDSSGLLSMIVKKVSGNQFVRLDTAGLVAVSHHLLANVDVETVYLCKKVPSFDLATSLRLI